MGYGGIQDFGGQGNTMNFIMVLKPFLNSFWCAAEWIILLKEAIAITEK